ncbi:HAD-like domain-containing protein, partial [Panaeolus papilionaceus]
KLTDHKYLIFDIYGTLADWETGLYNGLKPLLSRYTVSKNWTKEEALNAFGSVELELQAQYPTMVYSTLLAKAHEHTKFGHSIPQWPIFPDSSEALQRLAKHFNLIVLSNVDRESFRYTHALLSEGYPSTHALDDFYDSKLAKYTRPTDNPHQYWHPQETPGSKSPFSLILTAQDTGCYKPAVGGFLTALGYIRDNPSLFKFTNEGESLDYIRSKTLSVAQSLPHDHVPASGLGIRSVWIDRQSAVTCNKDPDGMQKWTWRFETLAELADAVEK